MTASEDATPVSFRLDPPREGYLVEYSAGEPGDPWEPLAVPFRRFDKAVAVVKHLSRAFPSAMNAHRVVRVSDGEWLLAIYPGIGGAS